MKILKYNQVLLLMIGLLFLTWGQCHGEEYVVLVRKSVRADQEWTKGVDRLVELHQARVVEYDNLTSEALPRLREVNPRYVAVVEKPEEINLAFIVDLNRMSREVDKDIYCDFLWGIITGFDAESALALVERAQEPKEVSSAWCIRNNDFNDGKYFEKMGLCDSRGIWYEKDIEDSNPKEYKIDGQVALADKMIRWAENVQPDLILNQVEEVRNRMPLLPGVKEEKGIVVPRDGKLWLGDRHLNFGGHSRIYFSPMSGARTFETRESMPVAWINDGGVTAFLGSIAFSFHGRGTWGALKYWLTDAGRFTLAEANFLNQQDILWHLNKWEPELLHKSFQYSDDPVKMIQQCYAAYDDFQREEGANPEILDKFGLWYERDLWVYYGDPYWNVRAKDMFNDQPYQITSRVKGKKCVVTIKISENYSWNRVDGDLFMDYYMTHLHGSVGGLPLCYFFPQRLKNPRLVSGQKIDWDVTVNKDFLFIRDAYGLEPGKTYRVILDVDK